MVQLGFSAGQKGILIFQDGDGYINVDEFDNPPDNAPANLINSYSDHVFTCCSDSIYVDPDYDYGSLGLCYYKSKVLNKSEISMNFAMSVIFHFKS